MEQNEKKELIKKFGTSGINWYVHVECINDFYKLKKYPNAKSLVEYVYFFKAEELIGKYSDITECDCCHVPFGKNDSGYLLIRETSLEEIKLLVDC